MLITAKLKYLRIAPRKVRLAADLIRGKSCLEALSQLKFLSNKTGEVLLSLLKSAIANAKNSFQLEESNLYISKITVDEGVKYKRWRAESKGHASEIQKRTSHITVYLDQIEKQRSKLKKKRRRAEEPRKKKLVKTDKQVSRPEKVLLKHKSIRGIKRIFKRKAF